MLTMHQPEFLGLLQVISGGQCGADRGGLEAARLMGVPTGGTAPLGYRTHFGPKPELKTLYNLGEDPSPAYGPRTLRNIEASDGTVIVASNLLSAGTKQTIAHLKKTGKPWLPVHFFESYTNDWLSARALELSRWVRQHHITVLNVAGNRDKFGTLHHHAAQKLLMWALLDLHHDGLLMTNVLQSDHERTL